MRAIFETLFDIIYLISVITVGLIMMKKGKEYRQFYLFGIMSAVLGFGFYIPVVL